MDEREKLAFDMYFSGLVAFQFHPRNEASKREPLAKLAEVAVAMIAVRRSVFDRVDRAQANCCQEE